MWTKESPTKEGYYWLKNFRHKDDEDVETSPRIAGVSSVLGMISVAFMGNGRSFDVEDIEGEWFGPIECPTYWVDN